MVDPPPLSRPTPGPVRSAFHYDRRTPFAAGQRRVVGFAARRGDAVAAPCRGRVSYAGTTPRGPVVGVRCGAWATSLVGVAPGVRTGDATAAGRAVGRATGDVVTLSLRPAAERHGYVDPRPWLAAPRPFAPLGPAPRARDPRERPRPRTPRIGVRHGVPAPAPAIRPVPVGVSPRVAPRSGIVPVGPRERRGPRPHGWLVAAVAGVLLVGLPAVRVRRATRPWPTPRPGPGLPVPSIRNGLLRHDPDLLRQRGTTPGARVLDDRR